MENNQKNENQFLNHKRHLIESNSKFPSILNECHISSTKCFLCNKEMEISSLKSCLFCKKLFCSSCINHNKNKIGNEYLCDSCLNFQKNQNQNDNFNKSICSNCGKENEIIINFKTINDIFNYLEKENIYKNEFSNIKNEYQGMEFKIVKSLCKNCIHEIKNKEIEYFTKIFGLDNKNNLIKIIPTLDKENPINSFQNKFDNNTQNFFSNSFTLNNITQPSYLHLKNLFYPNQPFLFNKIFKQQQEQNFINSNVNLDMFFEQSNPNDNVIFQNNQNFLSKEKQINEKKEIEKEIEELNKQIETMKSCNILQQKSLDILSTCINEFYKEVDYYEKIHENQKQLINSNFLFNYNQIPYKESNLQQQNQNNNIQSIYNQHLNH
jgi:hypothetical protein